MKTLTEEEALVALSSLCARAEHCTYEMTEKMRKWGLDEEARARVVEHLKRERYIDDGRYCRLFVRSKIRYDKWGRRKVEQALWPKHIDGDLARAVLDEVPQEDYLSVLRPMLQSRRRQLGGGHDYDTNARLARWAMGRGYTYDLIRQCMEVDEAWEEDGAED